MENLLSNYETLSIASMGPATLPKNTKHLYETKIINYIDDIDGAKIRNKYERFANKNLEPLVPREEKIELKTGNRPNYNLVVDDIYGARHIIKNRIVFSHRRVNPLEPEYDYPKYIPPEITPPKFLRDNISHDDIEGSSPKRLHKSLGRDALKIDDIEGTRRKIKILAERDIMNKVDDSGYLNKPFDKRTQRTTDLMNPNYNIHGVTITDEIQYTKPKKLTKYISDNHVLQTRDIPGAYAGSIWEEQLRKHQMTNARDILTTHDIVGAQADTLKRIMVTNRVTDPVQPVYQSLDGQGEVLTPLHQSLLPPPFYMKKTVTTDSSSNLRNTDMPSQIGSNNNIEALSSSEVYRGELQPIDSSISSATSTSLQKKLKNKSNSGSRNDSHIFDHYTHPDDRNSATAYLSTMKISECNVFDSTFSRSTDKPGTTGTSGNKDNTNSTHSFQEFLNRKYPSIQDSSSGSDNQKPMMITSTLKSMELKQIQSMESLYSQSNNSNNNMSNSMISKGASMKAPSVNSVTNKDRRAYQKLKAEVDAVRNLK